MHKTFGGGYIKKVSSYLFFSQRKTSEWKKPLALVFI